MLSSKKWDDNYEEYKQYLKENNNRRPKRGTISTKTRSDLFEWENNQRKAFKSNVLNKRRIELLNDIGFTWMLYEKKRFHYEMDNSNNNDHQNNNNNIEPKKRRTKQFIIDTLKEQIDILSNKVNILKKEKENNHLLNKKYNIIKNPLKYKKYKKDPDIWHMKTTYLHDLVKGMITIFPEQKESIDRILHHFTYLMDFEKKRKKELDDKEQAEKEAYEEMQKDGTQFDSNDEIYID